MSFCEALYFSETQSINCSRHAHLIPRPSTNRVTDLLIARILSSRRSFHYQHHSSSDLPTHELSLYFNNFSIHRDRSPTSRSRNRYQSVIQSNPIQSPLPKLQYNAQFSCALVQLGNWTRRECEWRERSASCRRRASAPPISRTASANSSSKSKTPSKCPLFTVHWSVPSTFLLDERISECTAH